MVKKCFLILILLPNLVFAQKKEVRIIIDSVIFQTEKKDSLPIHVGLINETGFDYSSNATQKINFQATPHYKNKITLDFSGSTIQIPIDNNGSYLEIANFYHHPSDSIHIQKLIIYDTQLADSSISTSSYFKIIKGKMEEEPFKEVTNKQGTGFKAPPKNVSVTINGINYEVQLNTIPVIGGISTGHGYTPNKYQKRNGDFKNKVTYLSYGKLTYTYYWMGKISLEK